MLTTGGACLPHGLSGTYDDYKRTTRLAIKWLQDNGATTEEEAKLTTCTGLLWLAESIRLKGIEAPREIAWAFRDAIEGRKHVNKWMREQNEAGFVDDDSNLRHEVFTETLEKIYDSLSIAGSLKTGRVAKASSPERFLSDDPPTPEPLLNRYEALYDDSEESDDGPDTPTRLQHTTSEISQPKASGKPISKECRLDFDVLLHDMVYQYVEAFMALMHLDTLLNIVKSTWADTARDKVPFSVATATCRSVWGWAHEDLAMLARVPWTHNLDLFRSFIGNLKRMGNPPGWSRKDMPSPTACTHGDGLIIPFFVMDHYLKKPSHPRKMPQFNDALARVPPKANRDGDARSMLLLLQCILGYKIKDEFDYSDHEMLHTVQEWPFGTNIHRDRVKVAFYLRLLVESHRGYFHTVDAHLNMKVLDGSAQILPDKTMMPLNPRIRLLKFVMEICQTFTTLGKSPLMQFCCPSSLGGLCAGFATDLKNYSQKVQYDLYFLNPYVAGELALNLYEYLKDYIGKDIINHRHYVASILHVYNALRCMDEIKPIPILEDLCSIFEDSVFMGFPPKYNYSSSFTRHRGGKLQYTDYTGLRNHDLGSTQWTMKLPGRQISEDYCEHKEVNWKRFEDGIDHTIFNETLKHGTHLTDWYWAKVLGLKNWVNPNEKDLQSMTDWLQSHSLNNHPLNYVKDQMVAEFDGKAILAVDLASVPPQTPHHHQVNSPGKCGCDLCRMSNDYADIASPRIRLSPGRPQCSCHKTRSRPKVLALERARGTGLLPVMRLNYGAVWLACADAFSKVNSSSKHDRKDEEGDEGTGNPLTCLCMVDRFLMDTDVWMNREKKSMKFPSPKLKKKWIKAIETFREKKAEEFLWRWL